MRIRAVARVAFFCVLSSSAVKAQDAVRGPDGNIRVQIPGVDVLEIPGAPFTANTATEWIRTLPDGSTLKRHLTAYIARDSSGRVYRERHHFVPDGASVPAPLYETSVYDPTTSTQTLCILATRRCVMRSYPANTHFTLAPAGPFPNGTGYLTRDSLGVNTMQGLSVTGTRETVTWNSGVAGNNRPLVKTREFWYSPDLQTNLSVTRNDPTLGQQIIVLNGVSRNEPEPTQFAIPQGYTVVDERVQAPQP